MRFYTYRDRVFQFEGATSVQDEGSWAMPWRIDSNRIHLFPGFSERGAGDAAGIRLAFMTDSMVLRLLVEDGQPQQIFSLYVDGLLIQDARIQQDSGEVLFDPLPPGNKQVEIQLDHRFPAKIKAIGVDKGAKISINPTNRKSWIHYGGFLGRATAVSPSRKVWTTVVAKKLNLQLMNLCFDGPVRFEPMVASLIRDVSVVDYITVGVEWGPGEEVLEPSMLLANMIGWIQTIREKHPEIPIALISPLVDHKRDLIGKTVSQVVSACRAHGDTRIFGVDGTEIYYFEDYQQFGEDMQGVLAERFLDTVFFKTFC
ncbi:MAG TPA: SGNH/GDSL hydrolase family protein [Bacillota bacterium]|nr:SGNH/GDSL hydrolase family protein [Bacillota bacterium]